MGVFFVTPCIGLDTSSNSTLPTCNSIKLKPIVLQCIPNRLCFFGGLMLTYKPIAIFMDEFLCALIVLLYFLCYFKIVTVAI